MIKRFVALLFAIITLLFCSCGLLGSGSSQSSYDNRVTNTYMLQILFGVDKAERLSSDENVRMLMSAVYLCCEQSDNEGQDKVDYLKAKGVSVPALSELRIEESDLIECAHKSWEHEFEKPKENQNKRKELLQDTTNKIFDFGTVNNWFGSKKGKCNSFSALLYYSHCLADYLADDPSKTETNISGYSVPAYSGQAYTTVNGNKPSFSGAEKNNTESFVRFSELDGIGRAGVAFANVGPDTLAEIGPRQNMDGIKPSGWSFKRYEGIVNSKPPYVYNRCHLLAHSLGGADQEYNLVTGTRYMNETGMEPFEKKVAAYVKSNNVHVLYRATPVFVGDDKLVSGVQLEAYSVEDAGKLSFNVYCYNVQPGISLNYANGDNELADRTFGQNAILPFAVYGASDSNPDLILEMEKHLGILFKDQENSNTYQSMKNEIKSIADQARAFGLADNSASSYIKTKEYEHQFLVVLREYIPLLLSKEDFFKEVFK